MKFDITALERNYKGADIIACSQELEAHASAFGFTSVEYHPPGYPGSKTIEPSRLVVYTNDKGFIRFMTKG